MNAGRPALRTSFARIQSANGTVHGVGFLAGDGVVCTCAHVVEDATNGDGAVEVVFPFLDAQRRTVRVELSRPVGSEAPDDIALLRLEQKPPAGARPARLVAPAVINGHEFETYGMPVNTDVGAYAQGTIGAERPDGTVQIERETGQGFVIARGFSGAPVWDRYEHGVAGMVVSAWDDPAIGAGFMMPSAALAEVSNRSLEISEAGGYFAPLTAGVSERRALMERFLSLHLGPKDAPTALAGREAELDALDAWLADSGQRYCLIVESAGRGKSSLLAHWAMDVATTQRADVALAPISTQYGTALREPLLGLLTDRLRYLHGSGTGGLRDKTQELDSYLRVEREPAHPLLVIIDGLDEAEEWLPERDLPIPQEHVSGVKVLLSARATLGRGVEDWGLALQWNGSATRVELRSLKADAIAELIERYSETSVSDEVLAELERVTGGDALLVSLYASALTPGEAPTRGEVMSGGVASWWQFQKDQLAAAQGGAIRDSEELQRLVDVLAVARGPLARDDLAELAGIASNHELMTLNDLARWIAELDGERYLFSHPELGAHFRAALLKGQRRELTDRMLVFCRDALAARRGGFPPSTTSDYALAHVADHLADALTVEGIDAGSIADELATLLTDSWFQASYVEDIGDLAELRSLLDRALRAIVASDTASHATVVQAALARWVFRSTWLRPNGVFALAEEGQISDAEERLALFDCDERWRHAARLTIAWVALDHGHQDGRELLARAGRDLPEVSPLPLLFARIAAAVADGSAPALQQLSDPPESWLAEELVRSVEGETNPSMLEYLASQGDEAPVLRATAEAPMLVALAAAEREGGGKLLRDYVGAHLGNSYQQYRDSSLWEILGAVVHHPDDATVLDVTRRLAEGALSSGGMPFTGAFPVAFEAQTAGPVVGEDTSDQWSHRRRTLGALAEVASRSSSGKAAARDLLNRAKWIQGGFAGYLSPAALTLYETSRIADVHDSAWLETATQTAHRIQDPGFCARSTARVNAMRRCPWNAPAAEFVASVERFARDPAAAEFSPVHIVGEEYTSRTVAGLMLLEQQLLAARSLRALAHVYRTTLTRLQRLNPDLPSEGDLVRDTEVRVPDSGFPALVASRFAAQALTTHGLSGDQRMRIIRTLVPGAAADRTALDTVLARLTLVTPAIDTEQLRTLMRTFEGV